jgi:hypothetical protein
MLLKFAEANAFNTSGTHNEFPKWGRQPKASGRIWGGAAPIKCSASIKSIGICTF